jgi:hypothetical protein
MKFQFYYEKLTNLEEYKKFTKENPEAYFCSAFFVVDKKDKDNKVHFDFYIPKGPKMYSFKLDNKAEFVNVENFDPRTPEKLPLNFEFDLNKIEQIIEEEMEKRKIKGKIQKLLFSLQRLKGEDYLLATIFISNMAILKVNIKIPENKITEFEKKSFMDMVRLVKGKGQGKKDSPKKNNSEKDNSEKN